ncbi:hypothetical protein BRADI_4g09813v3 [Brachypodium distachyon]|uniref:Uncharacterized protein n=1 Tax=Brachypodium distachyon TaxID=15368 RepID=A0A0Q3H1F9_BRADI|nr:hypothetical protein BRADI_4g09813v3 [Brachypodium distachyon]
MADQATEKTSEIKSEYIGAFGTAAPPPPTSPLLELELRRLCQAPPAIRGPRDRSAHCSAKHHLQSGVSGTDGHIAGDHAGLRQDAGQRRHPDGRVGLQGRPASSSSPARSSAATSLFTGVKQLYSTEAWTGIQDIVGTSNNETRWPKKQVY